MCHCNSGDDIERTDDKIGEHRINGDASLLGLKEQFVPGDPISGEPDRVTDTHIAIPEQGRQRTEATGTILSAGSDSIIEGI
jgi:hypothetical protein